MRKILIGRSACGGEEYDYYLLAEELKELSAENYGVQITGRAHEETIRGITFSQEGILALVQAMIRCAVTPVTARDVVEDWLAT